MKQIDIVQLPPTAITLAGNWESVTGDQPMLSLETRMRMGGFAIMANQHPAENVTVVFTGGLKADNGTTEADAMGELWHGAFPELRDKVTTYLDGDCYDTATSAGNTHRLLEASGKTADSYTFITSSTHLTRATKAFERNGFAGKLVPVAAEDLLRLSPDIEDQTIARTYQRSVRHHKRVGVEAVLRGLQFVDPGDRAVKALARAVRPNR